MRKKIFILIILGLLISFGLAEAATEDLGTIKYPKGTGWFVLQGNITLLFNHSDRGPNDVVLVRNYSVSMDLTRFDFSCKNISSQIDHNFVNNTKSYYFFDSKNSSYPWSNFYRIKIDFSGVKAPESPLKRLTDLLASKNSTISSLLSMLSSKNSTISSLSSQLPAKNGTITNLTEKNRRLQIYVDEYWKIKNDSVNLTYLLASRNGVITRLTGSMEGKNKTIRDLSSPFALYYYEDKQDKFYFNASWTFIGAVIGVLIFLFLSFKFRPRYKTISDVQSRPTTEIEPEPKKPIGSYLSEFGAMHGKKAEIREREMYDTDYADIEKEVLNIKEEKSKLQPDHGNIDKVISEKQPEEESKPKSWWDTPEGMRRREDMRKQSKGEG